MLNPRQAGFAAIVFFKRRVPCRRQAVIGFFIPRRARVSGQRVMLGGMAIHRIRNIEIREIPYRPAGGPAIHYSALLARKGAGCSVEDTLMAQSVPQSLSPSVPQSFSPSVLQSFSPSVLQSFSPSVLQSSVLNFGLRERPQVVSTWAVFAFVVFVRWALRGLIGGPRQNREGDLSRRT